MKGKGDTMTSFFLYEDRPTNKITIHKATCGDCQNGKGKNEETATRRGELHFWHGPAASYVAAQAWARRLPFAAKPRVKITDCGHCHPQDYP